MSTKDNEVNRRIDGETAEGHRRTSLIGEDAEAKKASKRTANLDDEAEGHRVRD